MFWGGFANKKINLSRSDHPIWKRGLECDELISACDAWCHTACIDLKMPIVGKCNKISLSLVPSSVYQTVVTIN